MYTEGSEQYLLADIYWVHVLILAIGIQVLITIAMLYYIDKQREKRDSAPVGWGEHDYLSTACHHGIHLNCRKQCKFCGVPCKCVCHGDVSRAQAVPVKPDKTQDITS